MHTKASEWFAELVAREGPVSLAATLEISEGSARHWAAGRATPTKKLRAKVEELFAIPTGDWEIPVLGVDEVKITPGPAKPKLPRVRRYKSAREAAEAHSHWLLQKIGQLDADPKGSLREKTSLANAYSRAIGQLAKLTGEQDLSGAQIVRSVQWRQAWALIESVVSKYPAIAKELADAFEGFGSE